MNDNDDSKSPKKPIFMPSFRCLQRTIPSVGGNRAGEQQTLCLPWKNFSAGRGRDVEREIQHQAGVIRCIRGQHWGLGNQRRPWALPAGEGDEEGF